MVSEESCSTEDELHIDQGLINNNYWESSEIRTMSLEDKLSPTFNDINLQLENNQNTDNNFVISLLSDIINAAVAKAEGETIMTRDKIITNNDEKVAREINRTTSIVIQDWDKETPVECRNTFVTISALQRSASESLMRTPGHINRNGNSLIIKNAVDTSEHKKEKKKKKLSFNSIFHRNKHKNKEHKNEEEAEKYDNFSHQLPVFKGVSLGKTKKYASALELSNQKSLLKVEKPSFFKKLVTIGDDSSNFLRRSLSFRDVRKKDKTPSREKVSELKKQEWQQSLQSLVESDNSVSYKDFSFLDYDPLDEFSYKGSVHLRPGVKESNYIGRSQSMREKGSPHLKKHLYSRHTSVVQDYRLSLGSIQDFKDTSAVSLPALYHLTQDNGEPPSNRSSPCIEDRRIRPRSIASDDGRNDNNSFRSSSSGGSGGAYTKLKRHNATRQKFRHPTTFIENRPRTTDIDQKVR